jgi:hypothetical protein
LKRIIPGILLVLSLASMFTAALYIQPVTVNAPTATADAVQANPLSVTYASPTKGPGYIFAVYVDVINVTGLLLFQAGFTFNATALQVVSVSEGGFLSNNGTDAVMAFPGSINNTIGKVIPYGYALTDSTLAKSGSGHLLRVVMEINPRLSPPFTGTFPGSPVTMMHFSTTEKDIQLILIYKDDVTVITPPTADVHDGSFTFFGPLGTVGITGYKLVFKETVNNSLGSQVAIDFYWSFSVDKWNGTEWVATAITGSSTLVVGYVIPALATVDLRYYVYLLPSSGPNPVAWDDWLRISFTFHWTCSSTNYLINYTGKLHVHPGDIVGATSVAFPYVGADGIVSILDVGPIAANWLRTSTGVDPLSDLGRADINGDGVVNILDVGPSAVDWLQTWTNTPP